MKNIIVGTAGHVDHGKTCLIKALTGTDTDRLKEEKKRGITIENGFADMTYGDYNISIIDVPGHERFINNMLMGIGGIDIVLLVVGLDEGVMPQTVEHVNILTMLGINRGIIVYTKKDLVDDDEWLELVKDDTRSLVEGTFLENAPEIEVSTIENYNIEELRKLIVECVDDNSLKNDSKELFRLPVDRVFTIAGFGTVVTGTLIEGAISNGDEFMVYPSQKVMKARNIQVHNESVDTAYAGQRTAINVAGVKKEDITRGSVFAHKDAMEPTMMFDVRLKLFDDIDRTVVNNSRVHVYCGSSEVLGKVTLLDRDCAEKGDTVYAQIRTDEPVAFRMGDRFIIRFYSPVITIGGGKILEVSPEKHKRNNPEVIEALKIKYEGSQDDIAELIVKEKSRSLINAKYLALKMRLSFVQCNAILERLIDKGTVRIVKNEWLLHKEYIRQVYSCSESILNVYHKNNQLSQGMDREEFKSRLEKEMQIANRKIIDELLVIMEGNKIIKAQGKLICKYDFEIMYTKELQALRGRILDKYTEGKYEMPTVEEALANEKDETNGRHIIEEMATSGLIVRLNHQYYIERKAFDDAELCLREKINADGSISLAEFRDMLGTSRKYAMTILDYLDEMKITRKEGDVRVLY